MVAPLSVTSAARVAFLLFAVAWGTNHFVPLLPLYRAELGLSPTDLAQVFGIYAIGLLPGLLAAGPLSDRYGRRAVVGPAALVALAGTAILGAGPSGFATLMVGRLVVGVGSGATFSAATAWVQDLAALDGARGAGARRAATALSAGFGGGPLVASVLAQWLPHPLTLPYVVQALVLAAAFGAVVTMRAGTAAPTAHAEPRLPRFLPPGFVREVVPVAPWVFGFPAIAFTVLPSLVRDQLGGYSALFTGAVTATTLFSGLLVQTPLRTRTAAAAGRFGLGIGLGGVLVGALAVRAGSPALVLIAAAALGTGYGGCLVAGLRFVETNAWAAERGRLTGIFYVLAYLGFAAPLILAAVAVRHGPGAALVGTAAAAAISLLVRLLDAGVVQHRERG
jgi:hypothetical protein